MIFLLLKQLLNYFRFFKTSQDNLVILKLLKQTKQVDIDLVNNVDYLVNIGFFDYLVNNVDYLVNDVDYLVDDVDYLVNISF